MIKNFYYKLYFLAVFSIFLPFVVSAVSVTPTAQSLSINPGESAEISIRITNNEEHTYTFTSYVQNVIADVDGQLLFETNNNLSQWIVSNGSSITLTPNETVTNLYTVNVPVGARPGSYHIALFHKATPADTGQIQVQSSIGSLLTLYVAGDITESLQVQNFSLHNASLWQSVRTGDLQVKNAGNIHTSLQGAVTVYGARGKELLKNELAISNIFAGLSKKNDFIITLPAWYIGPVTLKFTGVYGATGKMLTANYTSWYISPYIISIIFGAICVSLILILALFQQKNKNL